MKKTGLLLAGLFVSGSVFAYSAGDLESSLPGFFPEEVKQDWLEKQEEQKNDRRARLQQIRLQRLQREEEKRSFNPEEVLRQQEEKEAYQKWLEEQEEFKKQKELEAQQRELEKKAGQSIDEIYSSLEMLDELEKQIKEKAEADLARIQARREFLTAKLGELEEGDYSTGVKITNMDDAIDLESRFLENMMISPTETPDFGQQTQEESLSPMSYREQMKAYYRQKDLGVENGKLSAREKISQMRPLKARTDYNEENLTRAQKLQRALANRNDNRTTSQPEKMSQAVLRALRNRASKK